MIATETMNRRRKRRVSEDRSTPTSSSSDHQSASGQWPDRPGDLTIGPWDAPSRTTAITEIERYFDDGDLPGRSGSPGGHPLDGPGAGSARPARRLPDRHEIGPQLTSLGYEWSIHPNPDPAGGPFLVGRRHEADDRPTVLTYGHGDVVRGLEGRWSDDRDPWTLSVEGERWYGRGTADNKGQHTINLGALAAVIRVRGRLGFNSVILLETSEEVGSPGLARFAADNRELLAADVLIGSDGPRLRPESPTMFMGTRGALNFVPEPRPAGGWPPLGELGWADRQSRASGWPTPLASLVGPTGEILVPELRPEAIPEAVREVLAGLEVDGGADGPTVDPGLGPAGFDPGRAGLRLERFRGPGLRDRQPGQGGQRHPAPKATAWCQIRFTVDTDPETFLPAIRRHLDDAGFDDVAVERQPGTTIMAATRLSPDHPWARWARHFDRGHHRGGAHRAAQPRWFAAQRRVRRHPGAAHHLGTPLVCLVLAARPPTSTSWPRSCGRACGS